MFLRRRFRPVVAAAALAVAAAVLTPAAASGDGIRGAASGDGIHSSSAVAGVGSAWQWPIAPPRIVAPFVAPAHEYGPGHRGIDLAAPEGSDVHSPAPGVVGAGLVSTFERVVPGLAIGTVVDAGAVVGTVASGGHTPADAVHFGVREYGEYINPMLLLGGIERAVLLPCC